MEYGYLNNIHSLHIRCQLQDVNNMRAYAFATRDELTDIGNVSGENLQKITTIIENTFDIKLLGDIDTGGILDNGWSIYNNSANVDVQAYLTTSYLGGAAYVFNDSGKNDITSSVDYHVYAYSENDKNVKKIIYLGATSSSS